MARIGLSLLVTGMGSLVTGCGSDQAAQGEPAIQVADVTDTKNFTLPLDSYLPDRTQERLLEYSTMLLGLQCLQRFGYDIAAPPMPAPFPLTPNERRYGATNPAETAVHGYRHPAATDTGKPEEPELTAEATAILNGENTRDGQVPRGGCRGEAERKLSDGTDPSRVDWDLAQTLSLTSFDRSKADSRVRAAFSQWHECMKRSGYDYPDPMAANDDPSFGQGTPSEVELRVATTDANCKKEVGLVSTWAAVETAYQERLVEENEQALSQLRAQLQTRLRVAASVVEGRR